MFIFFKIKSWNYIQKCLCALRIFQSFLVVLSLGQHHKILFWKFLIICRLSNVAPFFNQFTTFSYLLPWLLTVFCKQQVFFSSKFLAQASPCLVFLSLLFCYFIVNNQVMFFSCGTKNSSQEMLGNELTNIDLVFYKIRSEDFRKIDLFASKTLY